jgi:hypothetical protein
MHAPGLKQVLQILLNSLALCPDLKLHVAIPVLHLRAALRHVRGLTHSPCDSRHWLCGPIVTMILSAFLQHSVVNEVHGGGSNRSQLIHHNIMMHAQLIAYWRSGPLSINYTERD